MSDARYVPDPLASLLPVVLGNVVIASPSEAEILRASYCAIALSGIADPLDANPALQNPVILPHPQHVVLDSWIADVRVGLYELDFNSAVVEHATADLGIIIGSDREIIC